MSAKRAERREDLRERLLAATTARIQAGGLKGLRARDVTADAGCALGALYNAFADLDDLIIQVNSATLKRLEASVAQVVAKGTDAGDTLKALALGYLSFARNNYALWRAIFEHRFADNVNAPQWQLAEHEALIDLIAVPLAKLRPDMNEQQLRIRSRTLFAAVHGIVAISLEGRFVGLPGPELEAEVGRFVDVLVAGLKQRP
jgi:AcrR family transcriptional regulator